MQSQLYSYQGTRKELRGLVIIFFLSAIFHVALIGGMIVAPKFTKSYKPLPRVMKVSIVSLPGKTISSPSKKQSRVKKKRISKTPIKNITKVNAKKSESVPLSKKRKKIKTSLKKKSYKFSNVRKNAIKQIENKVQEFDSSRLDKAMERLRRDVKKSETMGSREKEITDKTGGSTSGDDSGKKTRELINIYRLEIAYQIQKNWAFSIQLAGGRTDLMAELAFKVLPNGEIDDIWFDRRSGNAYLDESSRKAILKSNPVRPHPERLNESYVIVGLRFTPEGIF